MKNLAKTIVFLVVCFCCLNQAIQAQTTAFTYQGKLTDGGMSPTAQYDFQFTIFGSDVGGLPVSGDIIVENVQVTNGIFTVNLDFGTAPLDSPTDNHLEISVRPGASVGAFTTLAPRQRITSSPYSIKSLKANTADSLSAACVLCVTDAQISSIDAGKITGVLSYFQGGTGIGGAFLPNGLFLRSNGAGWQASGILASDIPNNLGSYIQNTTTTQTTSNFNISGTGTANIFNAATQYNIGGNRILSAAGTSNLFAGIGAGQNNTGVSNAFFGSGAGQTNSTGSFNAFFGGGAGFANTGSENAFFGYVAGRNNSSGEGNSFFGKNSGNANTTGGSNSFVGFNAGRLNTLGSNNTFLGVSAGDTNTTGLRNTIIGSNADVSTNNLIYATAIGAEAVVSSSNTLVLGRNLDTVQIPGALNVAGATTFGGTLGANIFNATTQYNIGGNRVLSIAGSSNIFAGINAGAVNTGFNNSFFGTSAGQANTANNNSFFGARAGFVNDVGFQNSFFGTFAGGDNTMGASNSFFGFVAGENNTSGSSNSFFGTFAGQINAGGGANSFFGIAAGNSNTDGSENTIIGSSADVGSGSLSNATALGANAIVSQSNSLVLGNAANVGIGTSAPNAKLHVAGGNVYISNSGGNLIMTSPNGACWAISVSNTGVLSTASVACP